MKQIILIWHTESEKKDIDSSLTENGKKQTEKNYKIFRKL